MNDVIIDVEFQYLYDLYYRVRNACLEHRVYRLDFMDWVKGGVAFNPLGVKNSARRVSYFGELYYKILGQHGGLTREDLVVAVIRFYDDIFQLYQDHLLAQLKVKARNSGGKDLLPDELIILPSFLQYPEIFSSLSTESINLSDYIARDTRALHQQLSTIYVDEDSILYHAMSLMFDYGYCGYNAGTILEVKQW